MSLAGQDRHQLLVGGGVVLHHAGAELLHVVALRVLLSQIAKLDLGHAAHCRFLGKAFVLGAELLILPRRGHVPRRGSGRRLLREGGARKSQRDRGKGREYET